MSLFYCKCVANHLIQDFARIWRMTIDFSPHTDGSQCLQGSGAICQARTAGWGKRLQMHQVSCFTKTARKSQRFICVLIYVFVWQLTNWTFVPLRCKKMVTASKRFTIHRNSNVLTLSLKRFANFSGGKITKVPWHVWTIISRTMIQL